MYFSHILGEFTHSSTLMNQRDGLVVTLVNGTSNQMKIVVTLQDAVLGDPGSNPGSR